MSNGYVNRCSCFEKQFGSNYYCTLCILYDHKLYAQQKCRVYMPKQCQSQYSIKYEWAFDILQIQTKGYYTAMKMNKLLSHTTTLNESPQHTMEWKKPDTKNTHFIMSSINFNNWLNKIDGDGRHGSAYSWGQLRGCWSVLFSDVVDNQGSIFALGKFIKLSS